MDGAQFRTVPVDLRFRSQGSQRLVSGQMVPFQSPTEIGSRLVEEFLPGAFRHQLSAPHRVALRAEHSDRAGSIQLGSGMSLDERRDGLWGEFRVARSPMGDHYLALLDDGLLEEPQNTRSPGRSDDREIAVDWRYWATE